MNTWNIVAKAIKLEIEYTRAKCDKTDKKNYDYWLYRLEERTIFVQELIESFASLNPRFDSEKFGKACGLLDHEIFIADRTYYQRIRAKLENLKAREANVS